MELESGQSMIQESIHPADAACSQESSGQPSDASLSSTTQGLPEAGLPAPSGYTRNFAEVKLINMVQMTMGNSDKR